MDNVFFIINIFVEQNVGQYKSAENKNDDECYNVTPGYRSAGSPDFKLTVFYQSTELWNKLQDLCWKNFLLPFQ